jgi:hypothetical protein
MNPTTSHPTYSEVLTVFNSFDTGTVDNFKDMLHQFQFPFEYNNYKTLAENRHDFKNFFSFLTNIRCAVIEGAHRCEAACRTLQGYKLGDPVPLTHSDFNIPPNSTLFKPIDTHVYQCQDCDQKLNQSVLDKLKGISAKVAWQKEYIVPVNWRSFFNKVLKDIINDANLTLYMYEKQEDFYMEGMEYRKFGSKEVRSNKIKHYLHLILTKAIFEYRPCRDLLAFCRNQRPTPEAWVQGDDKLKSLSTDMYQIVSDQFSLICIINLHLIQTLIVQALITDQNNPGAY